MNENNRDEILIALDKLNENTVATNNAINELQHYIVEKDKADEEEKEQARKEAEEQAEVEAEENEQKTKAEQEEQQTKEAQQKTQEEIYTEQLQNINTQLEATNGMLVGNFVTDGIMCGVLLLTILWNKLN